MARSALVRLLLVFVLWMPVAMAVAAELWIAKQDEILRVDRESGGVLASVPVPGPNAALAVDNTNGDLWVYHEGAFQVYDAEGRALRSVDLAGWPCSPSGQGGNGNNCWSSESTHLAIQGRGDTGWLVHGASVYRFALDGTLAQHLELSTRPVAVASAVAAPDGPALLVASRSAVTELGVDGRRREVLALPRSEAIRAMAYKPDTEVIWLALAKTVRRYDLQGALLSERPLPRIDHLAPGRVGELWAADDKTLYLLGEGGSIIGSVTLFGGKETVVDLVANFSSGRAWVASQSRVAAYAPEPPLDAALWRLDPANPTVQRLATSAGVLRALEIIAPEADTYVTTDTPAIEMVYEPPADFIDPQLESLTANGEPIEAECSGVVVLTCQLTTPLPQGPVDLVVSLLDEDLFAPVEAEIAFRVDSIHPEILLDPASNPGVTNEPQLTIAGELSEEATLTLDGQPLAVDDTLGFSTSVELTEGPNTYTLLATDVAGNQTTRELEVTLDTVPPDPPDTVRMTTVFDDGLYTVTGTAGSVEGGATVVLTNDATGEQVTVTADADGAFEASIAGSLDDAVTVQAVDAAGNTSDSVAIPEPAGLAIQIEAPASGAVLDGREVTVRGVVRGPANTGVVVNGVIAQISDAGEFVASGVPIESGDVTLTATATTFEGETVVDTVAVTGSGAADPLELRAGPEAGVAALDVGFDFQLVNGRAVAQVEVDFDSDGTVDLVDPAEGERFEHTYQEPGLKQASITVIDDAGTEHQASAWIVVRSQSALTAEHQAIFSGMMDAFESGDIATAARYFASDSRERYGAILESLAPHATTIREGLSALQPADTGGSYAGYLILAAYAEPAQAHYVYFLRGEDGTWRIASM